MVDFDDRDLNASTAHDAPDYTVETDPEEEARQAWKERKSA